MVFVLQMLLFAIHCYLPTIAYFSRRAIRSRMQKSYGVYFDSTTGITSVILTNTELIGPNKLKEIDDIPLIVVNIPPVLNASGHDAIIKEAKNLESWVVKFFNIRFNFKKICLSLYK